MIATESRPAWDEELLKNPHTVADKRSRVRRMFSAIAPSYDLNNRLHSLWMDQRWRRRQARVVAAPTSPSIDGSGTGIHSMACHVSGEISATP